MQVVSELSYQGTFANTRPCTNGDQGGRANALGDFIKLGVGVSDQGFFFGPCNLTPHLCGGHNAIRAPVVGFKDGIDDMFLSAILEGVIDILVLQLSYLDFANWQSLGTLNCSFLTGIILVKHQDYLVVLLQVIPGIE